MGDTRRTEREKQTSGPTEQRDGKTVQYVAMATATNSIKITVYSINYCVLFNFYSHSLNIMLNSSVLSKI